MAKNWLSQLQKLDGAIVEAHNPFLNVIRTPSPSVNFAFGNSHGLPMGYTLLLWGLPRGGKTILSNAMMGELHKSDPEALVIKFDTEMRDTSQLTDTQAKIWGVDKDRYVCYQVNDPTKIFDRIETDIAGMCEEGAPVKMIIIDSISGIRGVKELGSTSIEDHQIGDHALTLQKGLKRILGVQRKYKIALVLTAHARAEMDQWEVKRHPNIKVKMQASFGTQHYAEYYMYVERNKTSDAKTDLLGKEFVDLTAKDMEGKGEITGHKIRVYMQDSSLGPKGRWGEFTLDYHNGIINTHEEVFVLGTGNGIIERPNQLTFAFGERKWTGKPAILEALKTEPELCDAILNELKKRDLAGVLKEQRTETE